MEITKAMYEYALQRIEELLPVTPDCAPEENPRMAELVIVSGIVEEYENIHYPIAQHTIADAMDEMKESGKEQEIQKKIEELTEILEENNCDFVINVLERKGSNQPVKGTMKISDSKEGHILIVSSFLASAKQGGCTMDLYDILCAVKDNQEFLDKVEEIEVV